MTMRDETFVDSPSTQHKTERQGADGRGGGQGREAEAGCEDQEQKPLSAGTAPAKGGR